MQGASEGFSEVTSNFSLQEYESTKRTLEQMHKQMSFNLENFANATEDIIHQKVSEIVLQGFASTPNEGGQAPPEEANTGTRKSNGTDGRAGAQGKQKFILSRGQRDRWNEIIKKIPEGNRVYIQA